MSAKSTKPRKSKARGSRGVTIASFSPGCFQEFTSVGLPIPPPSTVDKKSANGSSNGKKKLTATDRSHLKSIEAILNNSINLAKHIEDANSSKMLKLLREARDLAIKLRG
jgi:hypothetical protein